MSSAESREFIQAGEASEIDKKFVSENLNHHENATTSPDALANDVKATSEAKDFDDEVRREYLKQQKAETRRQEQANQLRSWFHSLAWITVSACVTSSAVLVGWQVGLNRASNALLIAFVSGVTVQVIGILAIVARYLFAPPDVSRREHPSKG